MLPKPPLGPFGFPKPQKCLSGQAVPFHPVVRPHPGVISFPASPSNLQAPELVLTQMWEPLCRFQVAVGETSEEFPDIVVNLRWIRERGGE